MKNVLISVDTQYDFTREGGKHYNRERCSPYFIRNEIVPFLVDKKIKIGEIVSDYRQPRSGDSDESCIPGTWGYTSEIPPEIISFRLVKSMNSPLYARSYGGNRDHEAGPPYIDHSRFYDWMISTAGSGVGRVDKIILIGLTLDCCVLCTAQILRMHGHNVLIVLEGTDTYNPHLQPKDAVMQMVVSNWAEPISWGQAKQIL